MIVRIWHGRTKRSRADEYERFLAARAIPGYRSVPGNLEAQVLRRDEGEVTHFLTVTRWASEEAIRGFAGADVLKARYDPEDEDFLLEFEPQAQHFEVTASAGEGGASPPGAAGLEGATPILRVQSLDRTFEHYARVLGFERRWRDGMTAAMGRGRCELMFCEECQGHFGTWVWVGAGDVDRLHQEYVGAGARVRWPPTNYPWAYEMHIEDPDGHVLRFGAEPKSDRPFGEWLDSRGERWVMTSPGRWERSAAAP